MTGVEDSAKSARASTWLRGLVRSAAPRGRLRPRAAYQSPSTLETGGLGFRRSERSSATMTTAATAKIAAMITVSIP